MDDVVFTVPHGELKLVTKTGTAAGTDLDVAPASGRKWLVIDMWGTHDDSGGNQDISWQLYNSVSGAIARTLANIAAYVLLPFSANGTAYPNTLLSPMVIDDTVYMRLHAGAMGAGKKLYAYGIVLEFTK